MKYIETFLTHNLDIKQNLCSMIFFSDLVEKLQSAIPSLCITGLPFHHNARILMLILTTNQLNYHKFQVSKNAI